MKLSAPSTEELRQLSRKLWSLADQAERVRVAVEKMPAREYGQFLREHPPRSRERGWEQFLHDSGDELAAIAETFEGLYWSYVHGFQPGRQCGYPECEVCKRRSTLKVIDGGRT